MTTAPALVSARTVFVDKDGRLTAEGLKILARLSEIAVTGPTMGTEQATSGTSVSFVDITAGVKRIFVSMAGVSTNGTSPLLIQIGDGGGFETSGYLGSVVQEVDATAIAGANRTAGFGWGSVLAANIYHGSLILTLISDVTNTWQCSGTTGTSNVAATVTTAGSKSLSAGLDRVRLIATNGTDTFDVGGVVNIMYD